MARRLRTGTSHPFDRRLADDPPVQPERVVPVVATLITAVALALVAVGLAPLWPVLAEVVPASASALAASTAAFGGLLVVVADAARRAASRKTR
jgi:hypothetical protein